MIEKCGISFSIVAVEDFRDFILKNECFFGPKHTILNFQFKKWTIEVKIQLETKVQCCEKIPRGTEQTKFLHKYTIF